MATAIIEYRPPRIAMALLAGAALVNWLVPYASQQIFASTAAAAIIGPSGFIVMMWAWWQFQQRQVAICPTAATDNLITGGIYSVSRNPMYLGMVMILTGIATYVGSLPFYAAVVVYILIIDRAFCRYEEDKLLTTFGAEYEKYRSRVRRWL